MRITEPINDEGVFKALARRKDARAMNKLLVALPGDVADQIRQAPVQGYCGMRHESTTSRGFWIAADKDYLMCVTLPRLSERQAAEVWAAIVERRSESDFNGILAAYAAVTAADLQRVQ